MLDHDHLIRMLTRLQLTAIRDQIDNLIDEAGRRELTIREALTFFCEREIARKDQRRIDMGPGLARFPFVRDLAAWGSPMDTFKSIDSEGNLAFIRAARLLHEMTGDEKYLPMLASGAHYEYLWRYAFRTRPRMKAAMTGDERNRRSEKYALGHPGHHVVSGDEIDGMEPVVIAVHSEDLRAECPPADDSHCISDKREHGD